MLNTWSLQTNVNILDSTGTAPYLGDVLVKDQRIVKVGGTLSPEDLVGVHVFQGKGRTLMSGMGAFLAL
jgi:dihydroorotase-like cyclic amidohydrolase